MPEFSKKQWITDYLAALSKMAVGDTLSIFLHPQIEQVELQDEDDDEDVKDKKSGKPKKENLYNITPKVIKLLKNSVDDAADDDGWAFLGDVGSLILKKQPNFDSRNFGFQKLTPLFKSLPQFEMEQRDSANRSRFKLIYVKNKD